MCPAASFSLRCHTFRVLRVFIQGGLYVQVECGKMPLSSVERLVIVRKGETQLRTAVHKRPGMPMGACAPVVSRPASAWRRPARDSPGHTSRPDRTRTGAAFSFPR